MTIETTSNYIDMLLFVKHCMSFKLKPSIFIFTQYGSLPTRNTFSTPVPDLPIIFPYKK